MTDPAATVALDAKVTEPTLRPAPVMRVAATACVKPSTSGTVDASGIDVATTSNCVVPSVQITPTWPAAAIG